MIIIIYLLKQLLLILILFDLDINLTMGGGGGGGKCTTINLLNLKNITE